MFSHEIWRKGRFCGIFSELPITPSAFIINSFWFTNATKVSVCVDGQREVDGIFFIYGYVSHGGVQEGSF